MPEPEAPAEESTLATGAKVTGSGYAFYAPKDWEEQPGDILPGVEFDAVATAPAVADVFTDNINVIKVEGEESLSKKQQKEIIAGVESVGNTDVVARDSVQLDGAEAFRVSSQGEEGEFKFHTDQFYVSHAGNTYVATFTFQDERSGAEREDLAMSVVNTWSWS